MSRGYRCVFLALVGCLIALQAQHDAVASQPSADHPNTVKRAGSSTPGKLPGAPKYEPDCESPKDREESDLCAQWGAVSAGRRANDLAAEANSAARDANSVSAQTLWWTRAGFVAVIATLLATAWAAWAAASAAKAANRSLELFKQAEGGELVPTFVMNAYNTVTIGLKNVGRTPVHILHADICCAETPPSGPIETFFTVGEFSTDVLISPEKPYIFGEAPQPIAHTHPECWFLGGAIYRTIFGEPRVAKIAIYLDRTTGKYKVYFPADFSKWDAMVQGLTKGGRKG